MSRTKKYRVPDKGASSKRLDEGRLSCNHSLGKERRTVEWAWRVLAQRMWWDSGWDELAKACGTPTPCY